MWVWLYHQCGCGYPTRVGVAIPPVWVWLYHQCGCGYPTRVGVAVPPVWVWLSHPCGCGCPTCVVPLKLLPLGRYVHAVGWRHEGIHSHCVSVGRTGSKAEFRSCMLASESSPSTSRVYAVVCVYVCACTCVYVCVCMCVHV